MAEYNAGDAKLRIVPDASNFKRDLEAELKKVEQEFAVKVRADVARAREDIDKLRAEQEADPILVRVHVDRKGGEDFDKLGAEFGDKFVKSFTSKIATIGIGALPAAALAVTELAGAFDQLGAATVALPGILDGIGSSLATMLVGASGVKEAYSDLIKSVEDTQQNAAQHAQEMTSATNALNGAVRDEAAAQRDVATARREARQELEDLNLQLRGGQISEAQAILSAQKARQDLATGHYQTALDYQQAQLRVIEADQQVAESHQRNIDLAAKAQDQQAKGLENSDQVVAANDRLTRAHEATGAAQSRVNILTTQGTAAQHEAAIALGKLSPQARDFVESLAGMHDEFLAFRNAVGDNLFAGMSGQIKTLVDRDLPTLRGGFAGIATGINHDLGQLFTSLGSDSTRSLLDRILGNTAQAHERVKTAIDPLVHAFGTLGAVGSESLPRLADALGRAAERFDHFVSAADQDGRLDKWIDAGERGFTNVGHIILQVSQSVHGLTTALGGQGLLSMLDHATKQMAAFINSPHGQNTLQKFFAEGRREIDELVPLLQTLPGIFKSVWEAARDATSVYLPILHEVADLLHDNPQLVRDIADAYLSWKVISPAIDAVQTTLKGLQGSLTTLGTNFKAIRESAKTEMAGVDAAFTDAGKEGSGLNKLTKAIGGGTGLLAAGGSLFGVIGSIALVAVPSIIEALGDMSRAHDSAREQADLLTESENNLASSLERVTNAASAESLTKIADAYQSFKGRGGVEGNALAAAQGVGVNPTDLTKAALPGNDKIYDQINSQLSSILKPWISKSFLGFGDVTDATKILGDLAAHGANSEVILQAVLGGTGARDVLQKALDAIGSKHTAQEFIDQTAQDVRLSGTPQEKQALLAGTALNTERGSLSGSIDTANQAQTAAHGRWRLSAAGQQAFGKWLPTSAGYDGNEYAITVSREPDKDDPALKGARVDFNSATGQWAIYLSADAARADLEQYEAGGATRDSGGGYLAMVHPNEWMMNSRGRSTLGDSFLDRANQGQIDTSLLPHFDAGGPTDVPHMGTGALPGPAPSATPAAPAAPTDGLTQFAADHPMLGSLMTRFGIVQPQDPYGTPDSVTKQQPDALHRWMPWLSTAEQGGDVTAGLPDKLKPFNLASQLGGIASGFVLGFLGLDKSILSPSNSTNSAIQGGVKGFLSPQSSYSGANSSVSDFIKTGVVPGSSGMSGLNPSLLSSLQSGGGSSPAGAGAERWRPVVMKALQQVGPRYGITNIQAWADAMIKQIDTESKGDEKAFNGHDTDGHGGTQQVFGLGQFLPATFNAHNITGGSINDGTAQVYAMIDYVAQRYGQNAAGIPNYIGQGHGYDSGGWLMPGVSMSINNTGKPEAILTHDQGKAVQSIGQQFEKINRDPQAPQRPTGAEQKAQTAKQPGAAPQSQDHNANFVSTGIKSAATAIGNAASTAASVGSMGAGGGAGALAGGMAQVGGKVIDNLVNVGSSLLVGSLTGGSTANPYGQQYRPQQNTPVTAPRHHVVNQNGWTVANPVEMRQALDLRDAQQQQSYMANYRG